ncbi:ImpA family type VI secretion system protein [Sinorhizobium fredii]|uniref:type VI secretion system protein TssA n=1 Tax=Rhizobium fredii TaxID=380 RepID=UPI0004AE5D5B|nr:type VI secretion system ImpA family N-terminal domain-containing protein [Sinorhizobium fredii]
MELDDLLAPINEQSPCGPDLDDCGDNDYLSYTMAAESRLPERFVDFETGRIFDRKSIKLQDEKKKLDDLLGRSRDIRLLVLMAQFHAAAGDIHGFARILEAISSLISKFWQVVHPQALNGGMELRRIALEGLNDRTKVLMPLVHAQLLWDRRAGTVSLRAWQVAHKPDIAYKDEEKPDLALLREALSSPDNAGAINAAFEATMTAVRCLGEIRGRFLGEGVFDHAPAFDDVLAKLTDIRTLLADNAPHLKQENVAAQETHDQVEESSTKQASDLTHSGSASARSTYHSKVTVHSHREARDALEALETYFAENEPSSPALILVHQARLLIGRPLVEALAALAPSRASSAVLKIDPSSGFFLDMNNMKQLTITIPAEESGGSGILRRITSPSPTVQDRTEANAVMLVIEDFLAEREPSSPVTMLLARARTLMGSNFLSILKELLQDENKS